MPAATTYSSNLEDVRKYLERGFTEADDPNVYDQLPRLTTLAERRCARELKILGFIASYSSTMQAGVAVYAKPNRWRATVSMNFGTGASNNERKPLFTRSYEYCVAYWPNRSTRVTNVDDLKFYADYDWNHWLFAGTPDADYPFEANIYEQPPFLDDSNQTNWLTQYAPDLLLPATLLECTPFLKQDERIGVWQNWYDRVAQAFTGEDVQRMLDRSAQRGRD